MVFLDVFNFDRNNLDIQPHRLAERKGTRGRVGCKQSVYAGSGESIFFWIAPRMGRLFLRWIENVDAMTRRPISSQWTVTFLV